MAIYTTQKTFQNYIKIYYWCRNFNCFEIKYLINSQKAVLLGVLLCFFLINVLYFMSLYLKINPKSLHLQTIWKQDDLGHYHYYIILQNSAKHKHVSSFCTAWKNTGMQALYINSKSSMYHTLLFALPFLHIESLQLPESTSSHPSIRWTNLRMATKYWTVTLRNVRAFHTSP